MVQSGQGRGYQHVTLGSDAGPPWRCLVGDCGRTGRLDSEPSCSGWHVPRLLSQRLSWPCVPSVEPGTGSTICSFSNSSFCGSWSRWWTGVSVFCDCALRTCRLLSHTELVKDMRHVTSWFLHSAVTTGGPGGPMATLGGAANRILQGERYYCNIVYYYVGVECLRCPMWIGSLLVVSATLLCVPPSWPTSYCVSTRQTWFIYSKCFSRWGCTCQSKSVQSVECVSRQTVQSQCGNIFSSGVLLRLDQKNLCEQDTDK